MTKDMKQRHPKYRDVKDYEFPLTEDLEDTEKRVVSYWNEEIALT